MVYTVITGIPAMVLTLFAPGSDIVLWFGRHWGRWILATGGVKISCSGLENIRHGQTHIFMSNHQSNLDMLAIILTMPASFRVVAKKYLFYIPIFGQCIWLMGMIPINRKRRAAAFASLGRAARKIRSGTSVLFFPEGTRSTDGSLLPFKKGAFVIASQAGVPIIPVTIEGAGKLLPKGSGLMRPGTVRIRYGRPISTEGYSLRNKDDLMAVVRAAMLEQLGQREKHAGSVGAGPSRPAASRDESRSMVT